MCNFWNCSFAASLHTGSHYISLCRKNRMSCSTVGFLSLISTFTNRNSSCQNIYVDAGYFGLVQTTQAAHTGSDTHKTMHTLLWWLQRRLCPCLRGVSSEGEATRSVKKWISFHSAMAFKQEKQTLPREDNKECAMADIYSNASIQDSTPGTAE